MYIISYTTICLQQYAYKNMRTTTCVQQYANNNTRTTICAKKLFFTRVERSAIKYKNRNMKFEPMRGDGKDIWSFLFLNQCVLLFTVVIFMYDCISIHRYDILSSWQAGLLVFLVNLLCFCSLNKLLTFECSLPFLDAVPLLLIRIRKSRLSGGY